MDTKERRDLKITLLAFLTFLVLMPSASATTYTVSDNWNSNSVMNNFTQDNNGNNITLGFFYDTFSSASPNLNEWTKSGSGVQIVNNVMNFSYVLNAYAYPTINFPSVYNISFNMQVNNPSSDWYCVITTGGTTNCIAETKNGYVRIASISNLFPNNQTQAVMLGVNSTNTDFYINGTYSGTIAKTGKLTIGSAATDYQDGNYSNFRAWNTTVGSVVINHDFGVGRWGSTVKFNGTGCPNVNITCDLYASSDGVTYNIVQANASSNIDYSISSSDKAENQYFKLVGNGNSTSSPIISSMSITDEINPNPPPAIVSWSNNKTNDLSLLLNANLSDVVNFNATANQSITTWAWYIDGVNQNNNYNHLSVNFNQTTGNHTVTVNATNANGTGTQTWTVTVHTGGGSPSIMSWSNTKTSDSSLAFSINTGETVTFNAASDQSGTWKWYVNGTDQNNNNPSFTISWSPSDTKVVSVSLTNSNGTASNISWTVTVNQRNVCSATFPGSIYIENCMNLADITDSINNKQYIYAINKDFYINRTIYIQYFSGNPATLYVNNSNTNNLYLDYNYHIENDGSLFISNTALWGWDVSNNSTIASPTDIPYISSVGNVTVDVRNSYVDKLRFSRASTWNTSHFINNTFNNTYGATAISDGCLVNCEVNPPSKNLIVTNNNFINMLAGAILQSSTGVTNWQSYSNFSYNNVYLINNSGGGYEPAALDGGSFVIGNYIRNSPWNLIEVRLNTTVKDNIFEWTDMSINHNGINSGGAYYDIVLDNNTIINQTAWSAAYITYDSSTGTDLSRIRITRFSTTTGVGIAFNGVIDSYIGDYLNTKGNIGLQRDISNITIRNFSSNGCTDSDGCIYIHSVASDGVLGDISIIDTSFNNTLNPTKQIAVVGINNQSVIPNFYLINSANITSGNPQDPYITFSSNQNTNLSFKVGYYADIKVVDGSGNPINGANITFINLNDSNVPAVNLNQPPSPITSILTDSSGHTPLPKGNESNTLVLIASKRNTTGTGNSIIYTWQASAYDPNNIWANITQTIYPNGTIQQTRPLAQVTNVRPDSSWYRSNPNTYQNTTNLTINYTKTNITIAVTNTTNITINGYSSSKVNFTATNVTANQKMNITIKNSTFPVVNGYQYTITKDGILQATQAASANQVIFTDIIVGSEYIIQSTNGMVVSLNSPSNNLATNNASVVFNCSVQSTGSLTNITLYANFSGMFTQNGTANVSGASNTTTFVRTLVDGPYAWNCLAYDSSGNYTFALSNATLSVDTIKPTLANVTASSITTSSVTISWDTNELSNSTFYYGTTIAATSNATNSTLATSHSIALSGLSASTPYYYNISACDQAGNCNTSVQYSFTTSATPAQETPGCSGCGGGGGSGGSTVTQNKTNQTTKNVTVTIPTTTNVTNTTVTPQEPEMKIKAQDKISEIKAKLTPSDTKAKEKLDDAQAAYNAGDYSQAYSLALEAEGLMKSLTATGEEAQKSKPSYDGYVIALLVLVVGIWAAKSGLLHKSAKEKMRQPLQEKPQEAPRPKAAGKKQLIESASKNDNLDDIEKRLEEIKRKIGK